jgi:beta-barrel assembly-enhancing protease
LLSSTAFDREQEHEADTAAVHMMAKAGIDPEHLANFLFRLSQEKYNIPKHFELLSTHPNSQDRAAEILKLRKQERFDSRPVTDSLMWRNVKRILAESHEK